MDEHENSSSSNGFTARLVELRRRLNACPEVGFDLARTVAIVEERLDALGIGCRRLGGAGVAALLPGAESGTVLLRADRDALPMEGGAMHSCGHDVHSACLLGAAELLKREKPPCNVLLVFQPAEETSGGALPMIEEGLLDGLDARAAFALHCDPSLPAGRIGVHSGTVRAASDMFDCVIRGRGAHGAEPHRGDDVIAIACRAVDALMQLVGRTVDPTEPAVLSIGSFHAGEARNALPERAEFSGILRTLDEETRISLRARILRTVMNIPDVLGATGEVVFTEGYPSLVNDADLAELVFGAAIDLLGEGGPVRLTRPSMGVDDFAHFTRLVPGCYFMLGVGHGDGRKEAPLHSPRFEPDERAIPVGAALMAELALRAGRLYQK